MCVSFSSFYSKIASSFSTMIAIACHVRVSSPSLSTLFTIACVFVHKRRYARDFRYLVHAVLGDTQNQIAKPKIGRTVLPVWVTPLFMSALVAAEIGGFCVLFYGYVKAAYA